MHFNLRETFKITALLFYKSIKMLKTSQINETKLVRNAFGDMMHISLLLSYLVKAAVFMLRCTL